MWNEIEINIDDNAYYKINIMAKIIEYHEEDGFLDYTLNGHIIFGPFASSSFLSIPMIKRFCHTKDLVVDLTRDQLDLLNDYYNIKEHVRNKIKRIKEDPESSNINNFYGV